MIKQTLLFAAAISVLAMGPALYLESSPNSAVMPNTSTPTHAIPKQTIPVNPPPTTKPQSSSVRGVEYLAADRAGHFSADIEINGITIRTLVDTGATLVAFGASDAERAGIRPAQSEYKYKSQTANGEVAMARVIVPRMRLGSIELDNIEAAVLPDGALNGTLLGMSFLKRLQVQSENDRLTLKQ